MISNLDKYHDELYQSYFIKSGQKMHSLRCSSVSSLELYNSEGTNFYYKIKNNMILITSIIEILICHLKGQYIMIILYELAIV